MQILDSLFISCMKLKYAISCVVFISIMLIFLSNQIESNIFYYLRPHQKKNSCSSDFPDKNREVASDFFFFDEAKFGFRKRN